MAKKKILSLFIIDLLEECAHRIEDKGVLSSNAEMAVEETVMLYEKSIDEYQELINTSAEEIEEQ